MSDNPFDASPSMLGYFYQVRYALFLMLTYIKEGDITKEIKIEGLDDIEVTEDKDIFQLFQTKHLTGKKPLTDSSPHFWKTIRIWSKHIIDKKINTLNVSLIFVINSVPSKNSIINLLSDKEKDIDNIFNKMNSFISGSRNQELAIKDSYETFNKLTDTQKKDLLNSIKILALQPTIEELLDEDINKLLIPYIWSSHSDSLSKDLDAWWFQRVIKQINQNIKTDDCLPISANEIHQKIQRLRDKYTEDAIPTEFYDGDSIEDANNIDDNRQFITQLKKIGLNQFKKAKQNYYKAVTQRTKWFEQGCFSAVDINNYENKLISEWEEELEKNDICINEEEKLREIGRTVYKNLSDKKISIHKTIEENYIMRGSYHILADKEPEPKIYWHPKFIEFLKNKG